MKISDNDNDNGNNYDRDKDKDNGDALATDQLMLDTFAFPQGFYQRNKTKFFSL